MRIEDDQYVMLLGDYTKWLSQTALPTALDRFGANQPRKGAIFKLTIEQVCLTTSLRKNYMPALSVHIGEYVNSHIMADKFAVSELSCTCICSYGCSVRRDNMKCMYVSKSIFVNCIVQNAIYLKLKLKNARFTVSKNAIRFEETAGI